MLIIVFVPQEYLKNLKYEFSKMEQLFSKEELNVIDYNTLTDLNVRWDITKKTLCLMQGKDKNSEIWIKSIDK